MQEIRYQLVTEDGETYDGACERVVDVPEGYPVAKFLERVYEKNRSILNEPTLLNFKVYRDKESLKKRSQDITVLNGLVETGKIPLLVVVPSGKLGKDVHQKILWKDEPPQRKPLLNKKRLHFFNRVEATEQLLSVHEKTFSRANDWEVAICAGDFGSGKSWFAKQYISLISQLPKKAQSDYKVVSILKRAVTVHVSLKKPDADQTESLPAQILALIKKEIASKVAQDIDFETFPDSLVAFMEKFIEESDRPIFLVVDNKAIRLHIFLRRTDSKESIEEALLRQITKALEKKTETTLDFESFPSNIFGFMEALVRQSQRPIFLVIDEVTEPFDEDKYWSEEIQADQLVRLNLFVESVIYRLVKIPGLFLLLCGQAEFLNWVGTKPRDPKLYIDGKIYGYRIALDLIYPNKIVDVLTNTVVCDGNLDVTLAKFLNLEGPADRLTSYANQIFHVCNSHPKSLCRILLDRCKAIRDRAIEVTERHRFFIEDEAAKPSNWIAEFAGSLFPKKIASLLKAFKDKETYYDIDEIVNDRAHLRHVISAIFISIEKVHDNCYQLHIPDCVHLILQALVGSTRDFLSCVNHVRVIPTDFHYFFEILILKKFNQVFSLRNKLVQLDPCFLGSPILGNWENLPSSDVLKMFPCVTKRFLGQYEVGHLIVEPKNAKSIIFQNLTPHGAWLIPRRPSVSPSLV